MKQFDVIKLKNNDKAIIKKVISKKEYLAHIVKEDNKEVQEKIVTNKEIEKVLYSREKQR